MCRICYIADDFQFEISNPKEVCMQHTSSGLAIPTETLYLRIMQCITGKIFSENKN